MCSGSTGGKEDGPEGRGRGLATGDAAFREGISEVSVLLQCQDTFRAKRLLSSDFEKQVLLSYH